MSPCKAKKCKKCGCKLDQSNCCKECNLCKDDCKCNEKKEDCSRCKHKLDCRK